MPIKSFQDTEGIPLDHLRNIEGFTVPQMYFYLDNYPCVNRFIENKLILKGEKLFNSFDIIDEKNICP